MRNVQIAVRWFGRQAMRYEMLIVWLHVCPSDERDRFSHALV